MEASKDAFLALQQDGYIRYKDLPLRAKDRRLVPVEFVSNIYWAGGERVIQCNIRDITECKQAEDALIESKSTLREQSVRDHLTGLFNRRYLDETLPRELHLAQRRKAPLCIVMLDIDGFKQFNDSFGHGAGDSLLREFGRALRECLRKSDIACRFGGDEFVLVLPDSPLADIQERMEQIRIIVKDLKIRYGEQMVGMISLSVGIAQAPEHGTTESELRQAADQAMYTAKQSGGDRIVIYQPESINNLPQMD